MIVDEENVDLDWLVIQEERGRMLTKVKMGRFVRESQKEKKSRLKNEGVELDQCKPTQGGSLHLVRLVTFPIMEN